jgi:hypothetical protein
MYLIPNSYGATLREFNSCHSPEDGKFCSDGGSRAAIDGISDRIQKNVAAWRKKTGNTREVMAGRVQAFFDRATPELRRAGEAWYPDARNEAARLAKEYGISTQQAAGVIAALSPLREWAENKGDAERLLRSVVNGTADPAIAKLLQANVDKAVAIAKGADPRDVLWSGEGYKVRSFYSNISDPTSREATIDTHMLRILLADNSIRSKDYDKIAGNKGRYDAFRQAIFDVADKARIPPAATQAIVWLVQKAEHQSRRSVGARLKEAARVSDNQVLALLLDAVDVLFSVRS